MITPAHQRAHPTVTAVALLALAVLGIPVLALAWRVPWSQVPTTLRQTDTRQLVDVTLYSAFQATIIAVILGVAAALWLNSLRVGRVSTAVVRLLMYLPLAMPPVVGGLALTAAFGTRGVSAPVLDAIGLQLAFRFPGVVLSHVFVALPFVVITMDAALRQVSREVVDSAQAVGLSRQRILWRITLPAVWPAVVSSIGLAFARSLGEFGTTLTFAGSFPGVTRTLPIGIYLSRDLGPDQAYALAAILILLAGGAVALSLSFFFLRRPREHSPRTLEALNTTELLELLHQSHKSSLCSDGPAAVSIHATDRSGRVWSAEFPSGAITALVGDNGAGKTTVANVIAGRWRGADVRIGERVLDAMSNSQSRRGNGEFVPPERRGVVMLTQNPGLPTTVTPHSAVAMATGSGHLAKRWLAAAGLGPIARVPVRDLSGGQAAQVALIRALAAGPRVLILDEPLAAIDQESAARWRELLGQLKGAVTIVLITHDNRDISALADYVATVSDGRVRTVRGAHSAASAKPSQ